MVNSLEVQVYLLRIDARTRIARTHTPNTTLCSALGTARPERPHFNVYIIPADAHDAVCIYGFQDEQCPHELRPYLPDQPALVGYLESGSATLVDGQTVPLGELDTTALLGKQSKRIKTVQISWVPIPKSERRKLEEQNPDILPPNLPTRFYESLWGISSYNPLK